VVELVLEDAGDKAGQMDFLSSPVWDVNSISILL